MDLIITHNTTWIEFWLLGYADFDNGTTPLEEALHDSRRVEYHSQHLSYLLEAIRCVRACVRATYTRICCCCYLSLSLPCGVWVINQRFVIWIAGRERMSEVMWFGRFWTTLSGRVDMTIDLVYIMLITTTT